jgi:nucleoside-diphosphate-sugar epimerase
MNILVTGANGLVGQHLIRQTGFSFYAATRSQPDQSGVSWLPTDLSKDFETSHFPRSLDALVYLAQSKRYRDLPNGAEDLIRVNVGGVVKMLQYALTLDPKPQVILASTGDVYGRSLGEPFREADPFFQNINGLPPLYPLSRKIAEEYASSFASQFGLRLTIIRLFHIYGEGMPQTALITRLWDSITHGHLIRLDGENGISINPTYVADVVRCIISLMIQTPQRNPIEVYNIAGARTYSLRQIGEIIGERIGKNPIFETHLPQQALYITPSIDKFMTHYGAFETVSFEDGFARISRSGG